MTGVNRITWMRLLGDQLEEQKDCLSEYSVTWDTWIVWTAYDFGLYTALDDQLATELWQAVVDSVR